jgi:hypothetical protein
VILAPIIVPRTLREQSASRACSWNAPAAKEFTRRIGPEIPSRRLKCVGSHCLQLWWAPCSLVPRYPARPKLAATEPDLAATTGITPVSVLILCIRIIASADTDIVGTTDIRERSERCSGARATLFWTVEVLCLNSERLDIKRADHERATLRACFDELGFGRDIVLDGRLVDNEDKLLVRQ